MKKLLLVFIFILTSTCFADEIIKTGDGKSVVLKDDHTWEYVEIDAGKGTPIPTPIMAKYAEEAVEIWDTSVSLSKVNYSDAVCLHIHYKNKTNKKVIGVTVYINIINPFGKSVLETTYDDEVVVEPMETLKNSTYRYWDDNPFIDGEPYDKLWQMAQKGTAKINTKVLKVIFEDGMVLKSKPKK